MFVLDFHFAGKQSEKSTECKSFSILMNVHE